MRTVIVSKVALGEIPQLVELAFMTRKSRDVHSIAHAFGTDIVVADVDDVAHIIRSIEANPFIDRVALEQFAIGILYKLRCKTGSVAGFDKHIARSISLHISPSFELPKTTNSKINNLYLINCINCNT